ncbi:hypothetical protein L2E82_47583 [Cichorium intybus]|uniref:Uncharacterized protein n=1 Tax=Cichorium intybus TaxID=13427 RepID=A0ACB8Z022_CICIN|nr:hypothetical protein L2E82_47583 [Cichorium intybus]
MAASTSTASAQQSPPPPPPPPVTESTDETAAKIVHKRYEGLVMVRTKAIKGKGAWYWAHLEPILAHNPDTGLPKAVKLRCCLCGAVFSASNPSRTASEHLKRGTCPNFNSDSSPKPISAISPTGMMNLTSPASSSSPQPLQNHRKRSSGNRNRTSNPSTTYSVAPITMIEPARFSIDGSYQTRHESMPALPAPSTSPAGVAVSSSGLEIEAVHSLVKLIKSMAHEISKERPRIGQCLPLWEDLRVKLKDWCLKFQINENHVDKVFDKRFKRNYHPAWAAAFILDPFYLIRDRTGMRNFLRWRMVKRNYKNATVFRSHGNQVMVL